MTLCLIITTAKLSSISVSEVAVERLLLFDTDGILVGEAINKV